MMIAAIGFFDGLDAIDGLRSGSSEEAWPPASATAPRFHPVETDAPLIIRDIAGKGKLSMQKHR